MLILLGYVLSTTFLGFSILLVIRRFPWSLPFMLLSGWCLGAMLTGHAYWLTTMYYPITRSHVFAMIAFQIGVSTICFCFYLLIVRGQRALEQIRFLFDVSHHFFLVLIIAGAASLFVSSRLFAEFPKEIPVFARYSIETELALLNSVVNGSNYERTSWFSFKDPYLANATFTRSAVPILYGASLAVLGCDYADIVTLVSFLNTLATAGTFFYFSPQWFGRGRMVMMLVFLIGGSGPLSRALRRTTDILETDLGPHIPLIAQLSFSLEASFSIPLAVFALTLAQCTGESSLRRSAKSFYVAAGIAAACIPSLAAGTAFFITVSNYAHCALMMMPFALSVIPKAIGSCLVIYPVWREYQVRGVFFAQIVAFFDTIGIPYLAIFLVAWFVNEPVFFHRMLSSIVAFIATCFVRQGMDHIENDIAVTGVVLPMVIVLFMKCLNRLRDRAPSRQTRGVADVLYALVIGYVLVSGIAYLVKIATTRAPGFDDNAVDFGLEVRKVVPSHKIVFNDRRSPNPVSLFAGRQVLFGKAEDVWRRGCDIRVPAMAYDRVVFDGRGAEVMRLFGIDYLAEYRRRPFILKNVTQWQYFDVLVQNDDWLLLKLIPEALAGVTYP